MANEPLSAHAPWSRPDVPPRDSSHDASSHVRERAQSEASRATRRVLEYLRAFGLSDLDRARELAAAFAGETRESDPELHARAAVRKAQARVSAWHAATFGDLGGAPDALWLRAFVGAHPEVFLEDPERTREVASAFGDASSGRAPQTAHFSEQRLGRPRLPGWLRGLCLPLLSTFGISTLLVVSSRAPQGWGPLEALWLCLVSSLFFHSAIGFWTAWSGFRNARVEPAPEGGTRAAGSLRVAVAIPIYHEDAAAVFARVLAMQRSLLVQAKGSAPEAIAFEMFVLSDSQDPLIAAEEERAFRRVTASASEAREVPMFYRRRRKNEQQKAGNLAEFFERFGQRYDYVVVLDADSLMRGDTMVELVQRIDRSPQVALLQAPILPICGETLLSRALQWGSWVAGPLFNRGLCRWSGAHGNYYGHNAVVRTRAFLECCALPALSGTPPLGGPLLSHDFVEAALLCRAGWEVRAAPDLRGSYEGLPPTLADYLVRDRRWCQGNLQHLRVALSPGFPGMSRIHLLLGVAAYLAGPAWLMFALVGLALSRSHSLIFPAWVCLTSLLLVSVMLLGPRVLGVFATARDSKLRREHGGWLGLGASFWVEAILASALSPILMTHHVRMVLRILLGRAVGWTAQRRQARAGFLLSVHGETGTTLLGLGCLAAVAWVAAESARPALLWWFAPVWLPLILSIPLAWIASSPWVGRQLERVGLLLVPSETAPDPIVLAAEELRSLTESDLAGRFRDLILDPVLVRAHLARLAVDGGPGSALPVESKPLGSAEDELCQRALRVGPAGLSEAERQALLSASECVLFLHREAWCHWPIENWQLAREWPQLPEMRPLTPCAAS
jgi:membrane glycosyltransferase